MRDTSVKGGDLPGSSDVIEKIVEEVSHPPVVAGGSNNGNNASIDRFLEVFERSARRWEMIVYPAMFAFILLAGYGFFLVYSLTNDMRDIASGFDPEMGTHMSDFSTHLESMANNVQVMADKVEDMSDDLQTMTVQMAHLDQMAPMSQNISAMAHSIQGMRVNMEMMSVDMGVLNRNVSRPMSFMNSFMPW